MPTEQQPEESALKAPAAAASAAGSFAQIQMYGRGARQRPDSTVSPQPEQEPEQQAPAQSTPAAADINQPAAEPEVPWAERAVGRLTRSLDDPALEAEMVAGVPAGGVEGDAAAQLDEAEVSAEMFVACSEQDAAAAGARLAQGQLVEAPQMAPPAPGLAPGL